jgi:hypothetical protein
VHQLLLQLLEVLAAFKAVRLLRLALLQRLITFKQAQAAVEVLTKQPRLAVLAELGAGQAVVPEGGVHQTTDLPLVLAVQAPTGSP